LYLYHIPPVAQVGFPLSLISRLRTEFPETVVGMKDSSGDWSNMQAVMQAHPDLEFFPGSELYLLDGLQAGAAGVISATANIAPGPMREVFDNFDKPVADAIQAKVSALRKTVQGYPVIPLLKAVIAHYRDDPDWAELRPPFTAMPDAEAKRAIETLEREHAFSMQIDLDDDDEAA
jgi:4-hydroxy-tetrahydrodipicolinate synthase